MLWERSIILIITFSHLLYDEQGPQGKLCFVSFRTLMLEAVKCGVASAPSEVNGSCRC